MPFETFVCAFCDFICDSNDFLWFLYVTFCDINEDMQKISVICPSTVRFQRIAGTQVVEVRQIVNLVMIPPHSGKCLSLRTVSSANAAWTTTKQSTSDAHDFMLIDDSQ